MEDKNCNTTRWYRATVTMTVPLLIEEENCFKRHPLTSAERAKELAMKLIYEGGFIKVENAKITGFEELTSKDRIIEEARLVGDDNVSFATCLPTDSCFAYPIHSADA